MVDWVISRHIAASWRGSPGPHAAVVLRELDLGGHRVDEDLLAGAEAFGDVDHGQIRRGVQHRHDDVVVAKPFGDADDPLDQRFASDAARRHVVAARRRSARSAAPPAASGCRASAGRWSAC